MKQNKNNPSVSSTLITLLVMVNIIIVSIAYTAGPYWYWALLVTMPLFLLALRDRHQKKHAIGRYTGSGGTLHKNTHRVLN